MFHFFSEKNLYSTCSPLRRKLKLAKIKLKKKKNDNCPFVIIHLLWQFSNFLVFEQDQKRLISAQIQILGSFFIERQRISKKHLKMIIHFQVLINVN